MGMTHGIRLLAKNQAEGGKNTAEFSSTTDSSQQDADFDLTNKAIIPRSFQRIDLLSNIPSPNSLIF